MNAQSRRYLTFRPAFLLAIVLLLSACAEVAPPPGGPIDKTTPQIVSTYPDNGAVNVGSLDKIVIAFSERIVRPVTGRSVFVSPRQKQEPKISWFADRIEITLRDSLQPDQTYLVSVASTVADLRGNKLDSTITLAFSTGESLDSGTVSGYVTRDDKPLPNAYAVLYDLSSLTDGLPLDSIPPDYVTLSNKDGYFSFGYLPPMEYRLLAFVDKNRNELFNPYREQFAVPDRPVVVGGAELIDDLHLPLTSQDTTRPEILSATFTPDHLLRVRFGQAIPLALLSAQPGNARLISLPDTLDFMAGRALVESHLETSDAVRLYFGSVPEGAYRVEITYDAGVAPLLVDSLVVKAIEDKLPPAIVEFSPPDRPLFLRDIDMRLTVSEPLDTTRLTPETFLLLESDSLPVALKRQWLDPMHLQFSADLQAGRNYRLDIAEFDLVDLSGNALGDSLTTYNFSVLDTDSLGAIAGKLAVLVPGKTADDVLLTFHRLDRRQSFDLPVRGREYRIQVPAGKYTISGFVDSNGNGRQDDGSIIPFAYSETRLTLPDTVAVRARFETAGIDIVFK